MKLALTFLAGAATTLLVLWAMTNYAALGGGFEVRLAEQEPSRG